MAVPEKFKMRIIIFVGHFIHPLHSKLHVAAKHTVATRIGITGKQQHYPLAL